MQTSSANQAKRHGKQVCPHPISLSAPKYRAGQVVVVGDCCVLSKPRNLARIIIAGDNRYLLRLPETDGFILANEADILSPAEAKCNDRSRISIVFFGDGEIAEIMLGHLHQVGYDIAAVVTNTDRPGRRNQAPQSTPVKACAETLGLKVMFYDEVLSNPNALPYADIGVVVEFKKLPPTVYHSPRLGAVNLHLSLLPSLKGATPVATAIRQGLEYTGVTIFNVNDRIDGGDIYANYAVEIKPDDTARKLTSRLAAAGAALMDDTLQRIATLRAPMTSQKEFECDYLPPSTTRKHTAENRRINWWQSAEEVVRFVRSLSIRPGAYTIPMRNSEWIKILSAEVADHMRSAFWSGTWPGTMMAGRDGCLYCMCGKGDVVKLNKIQLPGGRPITGKDYVNGCQGKVFCICE